MLVACALGLQIIMLVAMVARAAMPLWTGTQVRVATEPVDPRSLLRGNYAQLRYGFSWLEASAFKEKEGRRKGEVIYVRLEQREDGLFEGTQASTHRPASGIFLRGRIASARAPYQVRYGIEAFFAAKKRALALEHTLREGGGVAVLRVDAGGRAALEAVMGADEREGPRTRQD